MTIRTYSELIEFETFEERYDYLRLKGGVGQATFGYERWINQEFYRSREWKTVRRDVIARDRGNDLGAEGIGIYDKVIVHHMNPMTVEALIEHDMAVLDPEYLISTSHRTHEAIHYGDRTLLREAYVPRRPGDTAPWRN